MTLAIEENHRVVVKVISEQFHDTPLLDDGGIHFLDEAASHLDQGVDKIFKFLLERGFGSRKDRQLDLHVYVGLNYAASCNREASVNFLFDWGSTLTSAARINA
jgi:hypothetical protein